MPRASSSASIAMAFAGWPWRARCWSASRRSTVHFNRRLNDYRLDIDPDWHRLAEPGKDGSAFRL